MPSARRRNTKREIRIVASPKHVKVAAPLDPVQRINGAREFRDDALVDAKAASCAIRRWKVRMSFSPCLWGRLRAQHSEPLQALLANLSAVHRHDVTNCPKFAWRAGALRVRSHHRICPWYAKKHGRAIVEPCAAGRLRTPQLRMCGVVPWA